MDKMNGITINPNVAMEDALQIDSIVSSIEKDMEILNEVIQRTIPTDIETSWAEDLKDEWNMYYNSQVPEAMLGMSQSAQNLKMAVQEIVKYNKGE